MRPNSIVLVVLFMLLPFAASSEQAFMESIALKGDVVVKSWKSLRDDRVVKQDLDYSCGAASLATILQEYYYKDVTEEMVLDKMDEDGAASFQDLANVAEAYDLKAMGLALNFTQLVNLKVPAIVYLKYRGDDHFSIIRGIAEDGTVWLGDPSWGNRRFSRHQFLSMWDTRDNEILKGKILLILPKDQSNTDIDASFFSEPRSDNLAETLLVMRAM